MADLDKEYEPRIIDDLDFTEDTLERICNEKAFNVKDVTIDDENRGEFIKFFQNLEKLEYLIINAPYGFDDEVFHVLCISIDKPIILEIFAPTTDEMETNIAALLYRDKLLSLKLSHADEDGSDVGGSSGKIIAEALNRYTSRSLESFSISLIPKYERELEEYQNILRDMFGGLSRKENLKRIYFYAKDIDTNRVLSPFFGKSVLERIMVERCTGGVCDALSKMMHEGVTHIRISDQRGLDMQLLEKFMHALPLSLQSLTIDDVLLPMPHETQEIITGIIIRGVAHLPVLAKLSIDAYLIGSKGRRRLVNARRTRKNENYQAFITLMVLNENDITPRLPSDVMRRLGGVLLDKKS